MRQIIIGFSRPKKLSLFAKAIMWVDNIPYDHVYIKWTWNNIDRDVIYQASKFAVNFESNITFEEHAISIEEYEIKIQDNRFKEVMQFCMDNCNKPYGFKQILGFAWVKILSKFGKKVSNPFPSKGKTWICSKIAAAIVEIAQEYDIVQDLDNVDPLDLNRIINELKIKRIK